ncbi:methyl-accepting chemotaxis protein [Aureimonas sp. SA4125]|uniref:methyl-accepting chemotaxis protein n=1 Tax=Aureimonas sp. SA4125 TaxID=2826993 RepID=UPI001CC40912|nr:methyl-accepting chemotaxis protein [Aureimonas sp. SA4125]
MSDAPIKRPLWIRITAYGFAAVLFASAAIGGLAWYRQSIMSSQFIASELTDDMAHIQADMDAQKRVASALALALAGEPETGYLIQSYAREDIIRRYADAYPAIVANGALQLITFVDAKAEVVARIHEPDKFGDNMTGRRKMVVKAIAEGKLMAGTEPGRTAVSMFASAPVMQNGVAVGAVDIGTKLTNDYFARLADEVQADVAVYINGAEGLVSQASTFADKPLLTPEELKATLEGTVIQHTVTTATGTYAVTALPFADFSGTKVGVMELASDITALVEEQQAARLEAIIGMIAVCLISLVGFLLFARSLGGLIQRLTKTMGSLAAGSLTVEVVGQDRPDEIGAMARAVQVFKTAALENKRLEAEAASARAAQASQRERQSAIDQSKEEDLRTFVHAVENSFDALSAGDLTVRMDQAVAPEFEPIREKFNASVAELEAAIGGVAGGVATLRTGLAEISVASNDLAQRTEQQAASLEETVAALSEVTTGVNQTAEGAAQAQVGATAAQKNAEKGGEIVAKAVAAMSQIEHSSEEIGKIIGVIDEIAFQTNLLALNAGVEAARAGEAGRGFAVVAQEVRGLAQRSAEAAKEIKALISTSSKQVGEGVELVTASGKSLDAIVTQVAEMSAVVAEIARSAKEQAISLREVSGAADQMDKVTQQNAAMVEEATAAAQTLSDETDELAAMVERFTTRTGHGGKAAPARSQPSRPAAARPSARPVTQMRTTGQGGAAPAAEGWEEF